MSAYDLKNKVVCITGGSMGIGRASAFEFAKAGAKVAVAARSVEALEEAASEIRGLGGEALAVECDVRIQDRVEAMVRKVEKDLGPIDVMMLNAGYGLMGELDTLTMDQWRHQYDVNFWGTLYGIYAVLPGMSERRSGQLIIVNSLVGKIAMPHMAPYTSTKFALTALTDSIRPEMKRKGIDVIGIYPSAVPTNFNANLKNIEQGIVSKIVKLMPTVSAEKAARLIVDASRKRKREVDFTALGKVGARVTPLMRGVTAGAMSGIYGAMKRLGSF